MTEADKLDRVILAFCLLALAAMVAGRI